MFTLQILHASDLEGGVDAIGNAPNFASIVAALEAEAEADGVSSILLSAGDNYIPGPFYNAAGDADTFNPIFEGLYNQVLGLIEAELISPLADTNGDTFFDNDEIEAFLNDPELNTNGFTFEDIYTTDINGDGAPDYFEEIDNFEGRVDISIMNLLGFDASAVGNHEFDAGTAAFNDIVIYDSEEGNSLSEGRYGTVNYLQEVDWLGAQFPYLSANLDFSEDDEIGTLFTDEILPSSSFESDLLSARVNPADPTERGSDGRDAKVAPATIVEVDGEQVGVVGATTQLISQISSTGNIDDVSNPGTNDMAALAAVLQPVVDELTAQGVDKIVLTSHLQQFALEQELAQLLTGVDVIIAGGSDTLLADDDDLLRPGDEAELPYPFLTTDAEGNPVAIVSTDGEYSYVGRLVVEFDENGVIVPESIDPSVSGAFGTDDANTVTVIESVLGTPLLLLNAEPLPLEEAQEVPALEDGPATGEIVFVQYFDDTNQLLLAGAYGGLSAPVLDVAADPTALDVDGIPIDGIHLHQGAAGENGPVIRSAVALPAEAFGDPAETGFDGGFQVITRLTDEEEAALLAGDLYINIHTETNPGGELRGQIPAGALVEGEVTPLDGAFIGTTTIFDGVPVGFTANLVDAVSGVVTDLDSNIFGETEVFIDGRRAEVRTQETTLGNLTADANLAAAQAIDPEVTVSLKNGGGIRAAIGETDVDGNLLPTQANPVSGKEEGEISELDIQNSLRFNNSLVIVELTPADLKIVLEHAVAATEEGATPGQFPQVGGVEFSFNPDGRAQELEIDEDGNLIATSVGTRVQNIAIPGADGTPIVIVEDGEVTDDAPETIKVVTLDFLVGDEGDLIGGDGYPYRALGENIVETGIGEQTALQDFLAANFPQDGGTPFNAVETDPSEDTRIQNLAEREDGIVEPEEPVEVITDPEFESVLATGELDATLLFSTQGPVDALAEDGAEGGSEVVAYEGGNLYVTNGASDTIDVIDAATGAITNRIDLSVLPNYDGVQSVAAGGGVIIAVADVAPIAGVPGNGFAAVYDIETLELIDIVTVGNLPDSVSISPDGTVAAVANEGEFNSESDVSVDALGTISLIDLSDLGNISVNTIGFEGVDTSALRIFPGNQAERDIEPEFTTFTPDGSTVLVSLQENNGIAVVDVASESIVGVISAGTLDHRLPENAMDATDDEVIDIIPRDVTGLRQPDAITTIDIDGTTYLLGANEGDGRGDFFDDGEIVPFADEARVSELIENGLLDPVAFPSEVIAEALPLEEAQEVAETPVPDTDATGQFDAFLDLATMTVTVSGTFNSLSSPLFNVGGVDQFGNPESAVHVHLGDAGTNGPIFFNTDVTATTDGLAGGFVGSAPVTEEQAELFLNEGYYINLHTENNQGGELRGQIELDETQVDDLFVDPDIDRLIVSTIDGDTDGDGDIDEIFSFGSRSFTIWDLEGNVVYDSGSEFERYIAENFPERFNDDDGETGQNRSDAKGPEPEAIAVGEIDGRTYAFVGAERDSGVFIYNITDPTSAFLVEYLDGFGTENISPETIAFIPADESATGNSQIAVAYEISGTTAVYDLSLDGGVLTTEDFYTVALGRDFDTAGLNFWSDILEITSDAFIAEAFDLSVEFQDSIAGLSAEEAINQVYQNGLGRDATAEEQAEFQPVVTEEGYDQVFLAVIDQLDLIG